MSSSTRAAQKTYTNMMKFGALLKNSLVSWHNGCRQLETALNYCGIRTFTSVLRQHRTIWQEHSAKDFASYESYKRAGILYVFPPFITARMGQKIGRRPQTQLCGAALIQIWKRKGG